MADPGMEYTGGSARPAPRGAWHWPAIVIGLLGGQILLCAITVYLAVSDRSFAIEPNYYRQASDWNARAQQERVNAALGWTAAMRYGAATSLGDRAITCVLRDATGAAVTGATLTATAFHHAHGTERRTLQFTEGDPGVYTATLRVTWAGQWELRIEARHGDRRFTTTQTVTLPAREGA